MKQDQPINQAVTAGPRVATPSSATVSQGDSLHLSPTFVTSAAATDISFGPTNFVKLGTIYASLMDGDGEVVESLWALVEQRKADVAGNIPCRLVGEELLVTGNEVLRPILNARRTIGLPMLADSQDAKILCEIGGYLSNADGIGSAVKRILEKKAQIYSPGTVTFLGNVQLPNPSVSAELSIPTFIDLPADQSPARIVEGEAFDASRRIVELPAQSVVDSFFAGKLSDPRFLEDVCELNAQKFEEGLCAKELQGPAALKQEIGRRLSQLSSVDSVEFSYLPTAKSVLEHELNAPRDRKTVVSARLRRMQEAGPDGIYRSFKMKVENRNSAGEPVGKEYEAEGILRMHDTLIVVTLAKVSGQVVMVVNDGARVPLECRGQTPLLIHTVTEARNLEGVMGSLTVPFDDRAAVNAQIAEIVREGTGHEMVGEAVLTDMQGYWSPGCNTSGFRVCFAFIQLDQDSPKKLPSNTALARPDALLDAEVKDSALRLGARVSDFVIEHPRHLRESLMLPDERKEYRALVTSESALKQFIRKISPRLAELMEEQPELANIITKRVNNGGLRIEQRDHADPDRFFFNSLLQAFEIHPGENPLRVVQLLWHDFWHYEHPDPLPFTLTADGKLEQAKFEEYLAAVMNNEIDAVMFSDVVLPEKYGIDAWDCEIDGNDPPKQRSLAALLHAAGIVDRDAQRAAVAFALEEGELPAPIVEYLHISGTFSEYESLIREKLLGYHVRDKLQNIRILYDSLTAFPRVAETAVLMGAKLVGGRSEYPERYSARVSALVSDEDGRPVRSGRNPLQEELGNLKTYSVYQAALRLQYIRGMVDPGQGKEAIARIDRTTAELSEAFHHLEQAARKVRGIEENPTNVRAFRLLREIQKGIAQQAASLIASLEQDETLISEPNRSYLRTHPHMPFPLLSFDERGEATAQAIVVRLVCESFAKAGYPSPLHK